MKQLKKKAQETEPQRPVDRYFEELDANFQDPTNRIIQVIFLPLLFFGVMGCIWMIPFPQFDFLVKLNWHTFLNWGSFFIAIVIYLYLKLSATLSYAILFSIGAMSYFIVQLEYVQKNGGPAVLWVCLAIALLSIVALYLGKGKEKKEITGKQFLQFLMIGPIWLWHFVLKRFHIRY
ncbi:DUF962 domain-containing protein [Sphingobacterium sp. N143]|uniref:Mpo1-like protein n=1 Tax=Sphingobacterium sp. N143 TaxID=2746727 RepID=UPI00257662C4|nr:Mpo1-like protein [Sphingobacterium sp. N143]MDM1294054.1 DUF962 domain-containing protein [Sphingobacterium sp. N143]